VVGSGRGLLKAVSENLITKTERYNVSVVRTTGLKGSRLIAEENLSVM
jgi:hypothetical protein